MSIPLTDVVYPHDQTGASPANRILNERHELINTTWSGFNIVIPKAAPFFDDSITHLVHYPSGRQLVKGRDWITGWRFESATGEIGSFVSSCIYLFDTKLKGHIEIPSYQCLGGEWQIDTQTLTAILAEKLLNPQRYYWEYVSRAPQIYRPLDHDQDIDEFTELGGLLDSLQSISKAIKDASESGALEEHEAKRNPHQTRPVDLAGGGLGNLMNWLPAAIAEMANPAALPTDRYMTPPATLTLINNTTGKDLAAFMARRDNPQKVTAAQAGTLETDQIHELIQQYLTGGVGTLDAATLQGRNLQGVVSEVALAIDPILKNSYETLYNEIQSVLANVQANDTAKFAGMTSAQWDQRIDQMIDAKSTIHEFEAVQELLHPQWPEEGEVIPDILETEVTTTLVASITRDSVAARANTGLITVTIDRTTLEFTINAFSRTVVCWSDRVVPAGWRFFLDQSGTSDELRLWMVAPANRVGAVVINTNLTSTVVSDGRTIYGASSAVQPIFNTPVDITVQERASKLEVTNVANNLATLANRVTTTERGIEAVITAQAALGVRVTALEDRPGAELMLVNEVVDIAAGASATFNLTQQLEAAGQAGNYDISKAIVSVRRQNLDVTSPTYESWVNAEGVAAYGMRKDLVTAFVYNQDTVAAKMYVRVTVPKN